MKFDVAKMAGSESTSARIFFGRHCPKTLRPSKSSVFLLTASLLVICGSGLAQALYKYRGPDGEWAYTDRAPETEAPAEIRELMTGSRKAGVIVVDRLVGRQIEFQATNEFFAPVELELALDTLENVDLPGPEQSMRWVLPPRSRSELLQLNVLDEIGVPSISYRFMYLYGDPEAEHVTDRPYRAPFAKARKFMVTQAYPVGITHNTADSYYAVDFAMPVGTDIYAARGGTVIEVAGTNYRAGTDPEEEGAAANLIRLMHDDGTFAIYAHLNWNTIRVKPGDKVRRGEYIADSGNTGFSTGPHLHFAVLRNNRSRLESLPVVFEGPNGTELTAEYGHELTAY